MSTSKKIRKVGESIEENKKALLYVAGIGLAFFLVSKLIKQVKPKAFDTEAEVEEAEKKQNQASKSELEDLTKKGIKPSHSDSQFLSYANTLDTIMTSFYIPYTTTNWDKIKNVFSHMHNEADILKLNAAFGFRRLEFTTKYTDLSGWLHSETYVKINVINDYLKKIGVKYRY